MACVAALALTTVAEARLAGGKCSAKAYDELVLKEIALAKSKYNVHYSNDLLTCSTRIYKSFFDQHCSTCGGDRKCIEQSTGQYFAKMAQNKKELVDFILSVFENPDCSAALVPMAVKTIRLVQKLGRAPTEAEVVRLLFPEANLAAIGADVKKLNMMMGKQVNQDRDDDDLGGTDDRVFNEGIAHDRSNFVKQVMSRAWGGRLERDEDDDIGALPALLMSPAAFKIAAIGHKVGPWIGPMKSAIMSNIRL